MNPTAVAAQPAREAIAGGCLCGAVRYEIDSPVQSVAHCHCSMCRRATGAVAVTWLTVPVGALRFVKGTPRAYASSAHGVRRFCGDCGAALTWSLATTPTTIDVTLGTLDAPQRLRADHHVFWDDRLQWLCLDPQLAGYPADTPADHPVRSGGAG